MIIIYKATFINMRILLAKQDDIDIIFTSTKFYSCQDIHEYKIYAGANQNITTMYASLGYIKHLLL